MSAVERMLENENTFHSLFIKHSGTKATHRNYCAMPPVHMEFALCDDRIVFARTQPATLRRVATSAASATSTFVEQEFKGLRSTFVEHELKGLRTCLAV
jgi:hypothetical protein